MAQHDLQQHDEPASNLPTQNGNHHPQDKEMDSIPEPPPRYSQRYITLCLVGYSLSFVIFGSQVSILGPTIAPLAERLGVSEPDLSPLFTALGISCIISGTPSGWLVDRMPTHRVLLGSLLIQACGFALVPFMPSIWSLTMLFFIIAFSYNFTNSAVFTSLGWMFPKRAGSALNLVLAMFGVGSFFIPLAAQACKYLLGSALDVFGAVAVTCVLAALPFCFVSSPTPPPPVLHGEGPHMFKVTDGVANLEKITTTAVVLLVFFTTAAETAVGNWLYTYGVRQAGLTDEESAFANSAFWGAFTVGRVLGAAASRATTPSILLLSSTPLAVIGASLPLWASSFLTPWQLVMATATLTGLGNSTGYANAVSLLETYVPVTGFINGVFGMVAGAACMVGPTAVALLAKYTAMRYHAMAWVGMTFYLLHIPAILTTMAMGNKLLVLYDEQKPDEEEATENGTVAHAGNGLTEPLLNGYRAHPAAAHNSPSESVPMPSPNRPSRLSEDGNAVGSLRAFGRHSTSFRHSSLIRTGSDGVPHVARSFIPGHASPVAGSMG